MTQRSPLRALFRPEELEAIVIGQRDYDWDELQRTCTYDGGFSAAHESIKAVSRGLIGTAVESLLVLVGV